jgi:hypothetical protein
MVDLNLDDAFINEVGMGDLSEDEKKYFVQYVIGTLQLRIGNRLSEDLSSEQIDEMEEKFVVSDSDAPEVAQQKQQAVTEWLKANHPNYAEIVAEETAKIKQDMRTNAASILESDAA